MRPPTYRFSLYIDFSSFRVTIMQSCNGLLLCSAFRNHASEYYVFNPTTKQLAFIPPLPNLIWSMALAFHPTHCVHYKVVSVCRLKPRKNMFQIQVYSSDTRTWKICVESFSAQKISKYRDPVYCNGAVYWAPEYCTGSNFVCFKLDAEQLQMLPLPVEKMSYGTSILYFGESRGHLHLIVNTTGKYVFNVYEMPTDHSV
ncbi:F-box protein At5g07610-like [Bidens hawaiensis]|uniref:F-box protein At5g07610-like n=1 Tax=Bidens hawaiensis TaxID=980011 RepID=UPI00404A9463